MTLGTEEEARLIYRRRRNGRGPLPRGWKKLGEGASRSAYLSPLGVVYKINKPHLDEDYNLSEVFNFKRFKSSKKRLPTGWRIAKINLYSFKHEGDTINVVAMQYIQGRHEVLCSYEQEESFYKNSGALRAWKVLELNDVHEGNFVITPEGTKVIIDLGE